MKGWIFLVLMALAGQLLAGQSPAGPDDHGPGFAPFVSRLKTRASESGVVLAWQNSTGLPGRVRVYRHTEEITADNLGGAELIARLDPDQQSYADYPPNAGTFFYAVLLEDESGEPYRLLIPFRNKTTMGMKIQSAVTEEELAAEVTALSAAADGEAVMLRFSVSRADRDLLLFRGTTAIRSNEDLLDAFGPSALPAGATEAVDTPFPGMDCYYAVVDAGLFRLGKARVVPGVNATVLPVHLAAEDGLERPAASPLRPLPLPSLTTASAWAEGWDSGVNADIVLPGGRAVLGLETARAVSILLAKAPADPVPEMTVEILPVDTVGRDGGEESTLRAILDDHLGRSEFAAAEIRLMRFLSIPRPAALEARAHFYLGQARYFQQMNREAFMDFLLSEQQGYREARPWLAACLRRLSASSATR